MGNLKTARKDILETLEQAGIKAIAYDADTIIPPVAIVVPDDQYILPPARNQRMKQWNIGISILLIASKGTANRNADELDDLIEKTVLVLANYDSIDIAGVTGPGKVRVKGSDYLGSIVSVQHQLILEGTP